MMKHMSDNKCTFAEVLEDLEYLPVDDITRAWVIARARRLVAHNAACAPAAETLAARASDSEGVADFSTRTRSVSGGGAAKRVRANTDLAAELEREEIWAHIDAVGE